MTDMPLSFLVWVCTGCLYMSINGNSYMPALLGYISLGLALLCKGPLAAFLVCINMGTYVFCAAYRTKSWFGFIQKSHLLLGILLIIAVAAPWYIAIGSITHGAFIQEFFLSQNVNRALGNVDHKESVLYYLPVLAGGFFPWIIVVLGLLPIIWRNTRRFLTLPVARTSASSLLFFATLAFVLPFVFFTALPTKLATYILPTIPALAFISGISLDKLLSLNKFPSIRWICFPLALIGLALTIALPVLRKFADLPIHAIIIGCIYGIILVACALLIWGRKLKQSIYTLLLTSIAAGAIITPIGLQKAYDLKVRDFHILLKKTKVTRAEPLLIGRRNPSAMFYLHKQVSFFPEVNALVNYINASTEQHLLLVNDGCLKQLLPKVKLTCAEHLGSWNLVWASKKLID